jgi:RsiW-degrading membrane proteinase PrsW (M82 family)
MISVIGGILPALFWLFFWLREDSWHPEPPKKILGAFLAGMASIAIVLPLEKLVFDFISTPLLILILWALAEELGKLLAAYFSGLRSKSFDEPVDAMVYLISAALGFAAIENIFFMLSSFGEGPFGMVLLTGNIRFVGASLLHVIASASIGAGLAFAWRKRRVVKILDFSIGLVVAVGLHTFFNFLILNIKGSGTLFAFAFVWISVIILIAMFELIKRIPRRSV